MRGAMIILRAAQLTLGAAVLLSSGLAQAPRPEAPNPEATSGAIQRRAAPPARITEFSAKPASIQAGQQTILTWATENPAGVTIEPGIGRVVTRGTRAVT